MLGVGDTPLVLAFLRVHVCPNELLFVNKWFWEMSQTIPLFEKKERESSADFPLSLFSPALFPDKPGDK